MSETTGLFLLSIFYFGLLFGIAYYTDKRKALGKRFINSASVYALSLAVYCTDWTFYGSVGWASKRGLTFLPIYLGPTLMMLLWPSVIKKIVRICKLYSITSIADFISSRYGKSTFLGGVVAFIAFVGILPYIVVQLMAISSTFQLMSVPSPSVFTNPPEYLNVLSDSSFYVTIVMIVFVILFGERQLDSTEKHEGLVAAIAFESLVKLAAFVTVGFFIVYTIHNGMGNIFEQAKHNPELAALWKFDLQANSYGEWFFLTLLGMMAIILLPRQFQVSVVENVDENHLHRAVWLFPLYLFLINLFVLPIALAGRLYYFPSDAGVDTYLLSLPLAENQKYLAWFVFIGGLSAATGMIIVETVALSNMVCNSLIIPILIRRRAIDIHESPSLSFILLAIRRGTVVVILLTAYAYFRFVGHAQSLVSTGLISFVAVAQFAPSLFGGLYWKTGNRLGALVGLIVGFSVWLYKLPFLNIMHGGKFAQAIMENSMVVTHLLGTESLLGNSTMSPIAQATFWSLTLNIGCYIGFSLFTPQSAREKSQASLFVDVFRYSVDESHSLLWRGTAKIEEVRQLLHRFLGSDKAEQALHEYETKEGKNLNNIRQADAKLVQYTEKILSGAIGSVSARIIVASMVKEEPPKMEEVMNIIDATQQVIAYSLQLEEKSDALEKMTRELQQANIRLKELDALKDDFISTITHELRTPLTSIRAFSEILFDNPDLDFAQRTHFYTLLIQESNRLTRLINNVLDFEKMQSGKLELHIEEIFLNELIAESIRSVSQLAKEKNIQLSQHVPHYSIKMRADYDRLMQVMINLLSNAIKFCPETDGKIQVRLKHYLDTVEVQVQDNGIGISKKDRDLVFDKFRQVKSIHNKTVTGSGLGLAICKNIIAQHRGKIGVTAHNSKGATFYFTLPLY